MSVVEAVHDARLRARTRRPRPARAPASRADGALRQFANPAGAWLYWGAALVPMVAVGGASLLSGPATGASPAASFVAASALSAFLLILIAQAQAREVFRELRQLRHVIRRAAAGDPPEVLPRLIQPALRELAVECVEISQRALTAREQGEHALDQVKWELDRERQRLASLSEELARLRGETSIMQDFGGAINRQLGPAQLCGHLITSLKTELDFTRALVMLHSEAEPGLVPAAIWEPPKPALYGDFLKQVPSGQVSICAALAQWVMQSGKAACIPDRTLDNRCCDCADDIRSLLAVPLLVKERTLGLIQLAHTGVGVYGKNEERVVAALANQTAIAVDNVRLSQEAMQYEALKQIDKLKSELLSTVSHELRTPLASIKGYAESLLRRDVTWEEETRRDFLQIIDEESDRLGELIDDLLQMSRIEAGILQVDLQPCKVPRLVSRVVKRARAAYRGSPHTFSVAVSGDLPDVVADQKRVEQVLRNLLENAVKYSPEGGPIAITAEVAPGVVVVGVRDRGIGIAPEDVPRVFERFFRVDGEAVRRAGGTGLGLSICRGIIEKHNGRIWAESMPGEGSTFSFSLPVAPARAADPAEQ